MKVKEIMTAQPRTCGLGTSMAVAAGLMLDGDCGILPVVENGRLVSVVTDRDMYIALATRNQLPAQVTVGEVAAGKSVVTCGPEDDVHAALAKMKQHRIRRLPVEGFGGSLVGIVSLNDVSLAAGRGSAISDQELGEAFRAICAHHHPVAHVVGV
jgi:CBS domain-containing protein